jgi:Ni/Co efflux regulator RcnB
MTAPLSSLHAPTRLIVTQAWRFSPAPCRRKETLMKRFILAATAIVALGVPMAAPAFADPPRHHRDYGRDHRDYRDDRRPDRVVVKKTWKVGDRYDRYDRDHRHYREVDYRSHRLKAPPRGYHYVKDDNTGEIILAAIATGIIAAIIAN